MKQVIITSSLLILSVVIVATAAKQQQGQQFLRKTQQQQQQDEEEDNTSTRKLHDFSCLTRQISNGGWDMDEESCVGGGDGDGNDCVWCEMGTSTGICVSTKHGEYLNGLDTFPYFMCGDETRKAKAAYSEIWEKSWSCSMSTTADECSLTSQRMDDCVWCHVHGGSSSSSSSSSPDFSFCAHQKLITAIQSSEPESDKIKFGDVIHCGKDQHQDPTSPSLIDPSCQMVLEELTTEGVTTAMASSSCTQTSDSLGRPCVYLSNDEGNSIYGTQCWTATQVEFASWFLQFVEMNNWMFDKDQLLTSITTLYNNKKKKFSTKTTTTTTTTVTTKVTEEEQQEDNDTEEGEEGDDEGAVEDETEDEDVVQDGGDGDGDDDQHEEELEENYDDDVNFVFGNNDFGGNGNAIKTSGSLPRTGDYTTAKKNSGEEEDEDDDGDDIVTEEDTTKEEEDDEDDEDDEGDEDGEDGDVTEMNNEEEEVYDDDTLFISDYGGGR